MACKVRKVAPPRPVYPPQASPPLAPCPTDSIGGPRPVTERVFFGRFFPPKPLKFTLEFTLETQNLGKLSIVPVLGIRYQVLGNITGRNIHNLKCIYCILCYKERIFH